MAHPINLRGRWEVALAEIQYPRTWRNIERDTVFYYYARADAEGVLHEVLVPEGHYEDVEAVLDVIRDALPEKAIKLEYRPQSRKVEIELAEDYVVYWKDQLLKSLLGIQRDAHTGPGVYKAKYPVDMMIGFYSLYVYTDIIQPVLVGDAAVPLLHVVPIEGRYGDYITKTYTKLHYVPLQAIHFESIEMNISTDTGKDVQFDYGKVVVKLHFRPRRLPFM